MRGDHPALAVPPRRIPAIRFAERHGALHMAAALAHPQKVGPSIFIGLKADKIPPATVVHALHSAKNADWVDSTLRFGDVCYPLRVEQKKLLELVPLLRPEQAYWQCLSVLPEYVQGNRQLLMERLRWWEAWRLLTHWRGKWTPDEVKLLKKIADG